MGLFGKTPEKPPKELVRPWRRPGGGGGLGAWRCHGAGRRLRQGRGRPGPGPGTAEPGGSPAYTRPGTDSEAGGEEGWERPGCAGELCPGGWAWAAGEEPL